MQQIKSLRHLGFSLEEIRECLNRPDSPLHLHGMDTGLMREMMKYVFEAMEASKEPE